MKAWSKSFLKCFGTGERRKMEILIATKNKVIIVDNNSLNKTCINGSVLEPNVKYLLKDGDMVKIANELFYFSKSM